MATSGTLTGSRGGSSTGPWLTLDWSRIAVDTANNKSQIRLTLKLHADYQMNFSASKTGSLEGNSFTYSSGFSGTGVVTLKTLDLWYTHDANGNLSTTIDGSLNIAINWGGTTVNSISVSGTMSVDSIPRASDFTAFSLSNSVLNKDTTVTVNYTLNRKSTSYSQDMTLKYGSTVIKSWNTTGTGALTQALTAAEVNSIISAMSTVTSGTLTLTMQTKSGTTNIGSLASMTTSISLNSAIAPTASSLAVSIYGSGRDKTLNKYVQLISKVTASFTSAAGYGASVSSNTIVIKRQSDSGDSQTIASTSGTTANAVKLSGVYSVTATVTDSRGRTATVSTTITVVAYAAPTITTFSTSRDATTTTNVLGTISASFSMGTDNPTDVSVVGVNNVGTNATLYTLNDTTTSPINLSQTYANQSDASAYTYTLTITDSFGNKATATSKVATTFVEFTIAKGKGISAGKVWEQGALDVGGDAYIAGNVYLGTKQTFGRFGAERIPASSDLNTYTTEGTYYVPLSVDAASMSNSPTVKAFSMTVERHAGVRQTVTEYTASGQTIWTRNYYNSTWGTWYQMVTVYAYGTNSNGTYVQYSDGTQLCWFALDTTSIAFTQYGTSSTYIALYTWTFPAAFVAGSYPVVTNGMMKYDTGASWSTVSNITTTNADLRGIDAFARATGSTTKIRASAMGRWK